METRPFYAALAHLNDMYGIEMKDDLFENIGLHAWDQIGNKNYLIYTYVGKPVNKRMPLPCNVDIVEAVLAPGQDVTRSTGELNDSAYMMNQYTENWIEQESKKTEALYAGGHYIDYTMDENTMVFKGDYNSITVIYKGVIADEDGLPLLNFKEVDAIAKYLAWTMTQKQAMISRDKTSWDMAQMLKQQWQFAVDDARTPIFLNQNDIDNILNVQSSWDRKRFGLTFKTIR